MSSLLSDLEEEKAGKIKKNKKKKHKNKKKASSSLAVGGGGVGPQEGKQRVLQNYVERRFEAWYRW